MGLAPRKVSQFTSLPAKVPWRAAWLHWTEQISCLKMFFRLLVLMAMDFYLQAPSYVGRVSVQTAAKLSSFWFGFLPLYAMPHFVHFSDFSVHVGVLFLPGMGLAFNIYILARMGWEASSGFMQGFVLEYMLSFDNLFVFHLIFSYYCTPESLVYRALYFGIAGAVTLRILIISVGYSLVNTGVYFVKLLFGSLLIYSGWKSTLDDEEEPDPSSPAALENCHALRQEPVHRHGEQSLAHQFPGSNCRLDS